MSGIQNFQTAPYHSQTNEFTERMNKIVLSMLRTLQEKYKSNWKNHLNKAIHTYNCTRHSTSSFSPYNLMFGRQPKLPIDLILEIEGDHPRGNYHKYLSSWKKDMEDDFQTAFPKSSERKEKDPKRKLETEPCLGFLEPRDKVLIKNLTPRGGPGKLRSFLGQSITKIFRRQDNDVTYSGKIRTLHRNMLMVINYVTDTADQRPQILPMKRKRLQTHNHDSREISPTEVEETASIKESDKDSDEDQLELTLQQLSHVVPLMKEENLKQNLIQGENKREETDVLIRNR